MAYTFENATRTQREMAELVVEMSETLRCYRRGLYVYEEMVEIMAGHNEKMAELIKRS